MTGKHDVKPETWRRWVRLVLENLKEPKTADELYSKLKDRGVAQKRVDSILIILEEVGLIEEKEGKLSLKPLSEAEVKPVEPVEMEKPTLASVDCVNLTPLDIESRSGSKLYFCSKYEITMGEEAEICYVCRYRKPRRKDEG